ncbi:comF family protein [Cyclonatronum proteinivorum]|uniref:ComF family protein n=1 Tax=Cyclonatronum proteinivorum TaxID=1457365 RepID=A0A345UNZ4_9BACT|nr:phosphoribosyltransferase family protein [Cyclonatronum proteinivorum]AXJ02196.1 comF family protein [Cyclonatronum proteinivorum]
MRPELPGNTSPETQPEQHLTGFRALVQGLLSVAFPVNCMGCGTALPARDRLLCERCPHERFSDPNPSNALTCEKLLLPEGILFQDALWKYDKGGLLNQIIHLLKYEGMAAVGEEVGYYAGRRLQERHIEGARRFESGAPVLLLPVPLHPKREQKRGYNQARQIALGMSRATALPVADPQLVVRQKNTKTQTRFSLSERMVNLKGAFRLTDFSLVQGRHVIIVDDVFTTGSTAFTLAGVLQEAKPASVSVFTIGMA